MPGDFEGYDDWDLEDIPFVKEAFGRTSLHLEFLATQLHRGHRNVHVPNKSGDVLGNLPRP